MYKIKMCPSSLVCITSFFTNTLTAQVNEANVQLLYRLDSASKSSSVSRHFAGLYFITTEKALNYFSGQDKRGQELMQRLELKFASYFFESAIAYNKNLPVAEEWKNYYDDTSCSPLRSVLLGINAHINGDIWPTLTNEFSYEELLEVKKYYLLYLKELFSVYDLVYNRALQENLRLKIFHTATVGLDKKYGRMMLKRWRKRQLKLAELYFTNKLLFEKKRKILYLKMKRISDLIKKNT